MRHSQAIASEHPQRKTGRRPGEPRADAVDRCVGDREGSRAKRVKHSPALHAAKIHAATL
jgi:hypothetical protein